MNRPNRIPGIVTVALAILVASAPALRAQSLAPKKLLIYYGWPSSINATFSVPLAAQEFGQYDYVVLGDGLSKVTHPDHANTVAIIADASMAGTFVFGYIDLGVSTQNLPIAEVEARVDEWKAMGADGIFLDDFGYDFQVSRARQNAAVDYAHSQGMPVVANAFFVDDAFGDVYHATANPTREPASLDTGDYYLFESHQIRLNAYVSETDWQARASAVESYRREVGFAVLSVTTSGIDDVDAFDPQQFEYAWYSALLYGHEATGWGEYLFSAAGASNSRAPYRSRPSLDPGTAFVGPVVNWRPLYTRSTTTGLVHVNPVLRTYGFTTPATSVPDDPIGRLDLSQNVPNPFNPSTAIAFDAPAGTRTSLRVFDVDGRLVRTLFDGPSPGTTRVEWDGRDGHGQRVASGTYFLRLSSSTTSRTRKMVLLK